MYQWMISHPTQRSKQFKNRSLNRNHTQWRSQGRLHHPMRRKSTKYKRIHFHRDTYTIPSKRGDFSNQISLALTANHFIADGKYKFNPNTNDIEVGIDTQASYSITNKKHMMTNLRRCKLRIKGIGGIIVPCAWRGDWNLPITDDAGVTTIQVIPDTILCEQAEKSLLSPQHFYQQYPLGSPG